MTTRPFIPVPNCVSVELIYQFGTSIIENVLHVLLSAPAGLVDLQAIRATVNTWDSDSWSGRRASGVSLVRIRTKALDSLGSPVEDWTLPTVRGGGNGGAPYPQNSTFCVRLGTGLSGRSFRGRLYTPSVTATMTDGQGNLNASEGTNIVNSLNTLIARLLAMTPSCKLVVVSYYNDGAWRTVGLPTIVTTIGYADLHLDSQRRRLPGRGI